MICKEYESLGPFEKSIYIGQLIHAVQNESEFYELGKDLIMLATLKGIYRSVKFHPDIYKKEEEDFINEKTKPK